MNLNYIKNFLAERMDILILIAIFISTFIIYIYFLAPSIFQGDSAEFCIVCYILGIPHPNGYPIYTWIGHLFAMIPWGSVAQRINMMSAFFASITVSLVYLIVFKLAVLNKKIFKTNNSSHSILNESGSRINIYRIISIIAAFSLAFSITFWSQAEIAEVYSLNAFFVVLMILILLKWNENRNIILLFLFFLVYGLSIGAHASNLLFMPAILIFIAMTNYRVFLNYKNSILFLSLFILGLLQFVYILIRASQNPVFGEGFLSVYDWWGLITAQKYSNYFVISFSNITDRILMYLKSLMNNFLFIGVILGIIGLIGLFKKNIRILILFSLMFLLNILFYLNYYVVDIDVMFIPSFILFSIFIGLGMVYTFNFIADSAKELKGHKSHLLKILLIFIMVSSFILPVTSYLINYGQIQELNNDNFAYFAYTALNEVPSNSTIITYWKSYTAFKYFQIVEKINPDVNVTVVDEENILNMTDNKINNGNVFIFHNTDSIDEKYYLTPFLDVESVGTLYKIEKII